MFNKKLKKQIRLLEFDIKMLTESFAVIKKEIDASRIAWKILEDYEIMKDAPTAIAKNYNYWNIIPDDLVLRYLNRELQIPYLEFLGTLKKEKKDV